MTHFAGKAARVFLLAGLTSVVLAISSLAAQLPADEGTITGSSVRMRAGASTSTSILTVMDKGTTVTVLGMANDEWYNISYKGMTGCVSARYLELVQKVETPPTLAPGPAAPPSADNLPISVGAITGSSVRMRAGASTSTSILTVMDKNTAVAVLGETDNGWYHISFKGKTGYVRGDYLKLDEDGVFTAYGRINEDSVHIRSSASTDGEVVATLPKSTALTVTGLSDGWYSVTCADGSVGYVRGDLVNLDASAKYALIAAPGANGQAMVDLAMEFLGVRYVYGGSGPKSFDCSGFTMYLCNQFDISMPHSATSQWLSGKGVQIRSAKDMQPGDLVFFCDPTRSDGKACSHCGVYIGDGKFVHASSSKAKVVISDLTTGYYDRYYVGGLRIF